MMSAGASKDYDEFKPPPSSIALPHPKEITKYLNLFSYWYFSICLFYTSLATALIVQEASDAFGCFLRVSAHET